MKEAVTRRFLILWSDLTFQKSYLTSKIDLKCTKNHFKKMINQKVFVYNMD